MTILEYDNIYGAIINLLSEKYGVDIHRAAEIGYRAFFDHATSIVIGETAVVGDDVSMLHEVTLGGTGNQRKNPLH